MRLHVADHPLIDHKLSVLRDRTTPSAVFRQLVDELVTLLAYEATREVRVEKVEIATPVATAHCLRLAEPGPIVVPILRAGLGMLEGMTRLLPTAASRVLRPSGAAMRQMAVTSRAPRSSRYSIAATRV